MVRISEIQQFPDFMESFPENFGTIYSCFLACITGALCSPRLAHEALVMQATISRFSKFVEWKAPFVFGTM